MYGAAGRSETENASLMTGSRADTREAFAREVARPDEELNLARAALLVAREEYDQLPVDAYMARLDQLAEEVKDRLDGELAPPLVLQELIHTLYVRNGFRGNREAYYDPRNSFLSDVLDRRVGIPLTLGMIFLEVGWRSGLALEGVNFPGHFMVRMRGEAVNLLVDPFDAGRLRFEDQAQELLDRVYGGMIRVQPGYLRPASRRDMLARLLTNLKGVYLNVRDHERALAAIERILVIHPTSPNENRDRGTLLARMGRIEAALEQLEWYLEYAPAAADLERVQTLVDELKEAKGKKG